MVIPDSKRCNRCGETKPNSEWHRSRRRYDGLNVYCKVCMNAHGKAHYAKPEVRKAKSERSAARYAALSEEERSARISAEIEQKRSSGYYLRSNYGLTLEDYDSMLHSQGGGCAICGSPPPGDRRFAVDHDHACCPGAKTCGNCIRGLLCFVCNVRLGVIEHPEWADKASEYLALHGRK